MDQIGRFLGATDEELGLVDEPTYHVYIRNREFERVAKIDQWKSLRFVDRYNNVGTWEIEVDIDSDAAQFLTKTSGIIITMVYNNTETTIFSGTVSTEYSISANSLRAAGRSDMELLEIPARPNPAQNTGPFTTEYDVRTGIASEVFKSAVRENIGSSAPSMWKLNQLNIATADPVGSTITWRGRFDPILTLLRQYSLIDGLGFSLKQSNIENNDIDFLVYEPEDKSETIKFNVDLNTAQDFNDIYTQPLANYVYVLGGDAFGLDRTIVEVGDSASITEQGRIIPTIIDRRGVTDLSELNQSAAEFLAGVISTRRATIVPFNLRSMRYVVHYNLGDLVTIVSNGEEFVDIIREVEVELDPNRGVIITPMVGQAGTSEDDAVATHIAAVQDRVGNIERNWRVPDDSIIEDMLHPTMKWYVGDMKITARSSPQPGWLFCQGQSLLASVYPSLFAAIGTTFGSAGVGQFTLPNCMDKAMVGAGDSFSLGESIGSPTAPALIDHSHTHSHGMNHTHTPGAHTHPGSHSHGLLDHWHYYTFDHDHDGTGAGGTFVSQGPTAALFGDGIVEFQEGDGDNQSAGDHTHVHRVAIDPYDSGAPDATTVGYIESDDVEFDTTESDSNAPAAVWTTAMSNPSPSSTEEDNSMVDEEYLEETVDNYPPSVAINVAIYTGVII